MSERIDLNKASKQELLEIQGVDDLRAEAILDYRQAHGRFSSVDELERVPGFGRGLITFFKRDFRRIKKLAS